MPTPTIEQSASGDEPFFESGQFFAPDDVAKLIKVPEDPRTIPHILGMIGPARGGTTAFAAMMAGHPHVDQSYFQPFKHGLRHGKGIAINPEHELIVMKDTLGPIHQEELFDPVDILTKAGVPTTSMTWIITLRDPIRSVASLDHFVPGGINIQYYAQMQRHTIDLYDRYRQLLGDRAIPFSFDMLEGDVEGVLRKLLALTGLGLESNLQLAFDQEALRAKMQWGEAEDPTYFQTAIEPTMKRGKFDYVSGTTNSKLLTPDRQSIVAEACMEDYNGFLDISRQALGIPRS